MEKVIKDNVTLMTSDAFGKGKVISIAIERSDTKIFTVRREENKYA